MATAFRGPLTSPACIQAGHGLITENRFLELHEYEPSIERKSYSKNSLLSRIDLHEYSSVTTGDIQQGLQWEIVLSCTSPLTTRPNNASKIGSNLAKLRRKSSVGGAKAVDRFSQSGASTDPDAAATSSTPSPSSSSSKSAAWLKSKLRSKSISASAASLALSSSTSSTTLPHQQPLPSNASVLLARNSAVSPVPTSPNDTPQRRPTSAENMSGSKTGTKGLSPLVLYTISRDLQLQWIDALSAAIAAGSMSTKASIESMTTSSSLPSLAVQASPSITRMSSELAGYAFPRRPSPSPLRMTAATNQAILRSQSAATSPTTSFLEIGPSSSSRSSTPCSSKHSKDCDADSPRTAMPSPSAVASRRMSANANPLLPQWLSDVRRNSSGSLNFNDARTTSFNDRSSSHASSSPSPTNSRMPTPIHLERPTMRQSKSSSFLNLDPRRDRPAHSPPVGYVNGAFPDRGIKISIHLDEEAEHESEHRYSSRGLSASQPARERRSSARTYGSHDDRPSTPPIYISSAVSSSIAALNSRGSYGDVNLEALDSRLLSASQHSNHLRPSPSSTSLSSNAASSLCGGGESVSSVAQSADPPTPNPPYIENLGTPQSCELTPTCLPEGSSKTKLQGYFGVPQEIINGQQDLLVQSPSMEEEVKSAKLRELNKVEKEFSPKLPLHARLGAVFSSNNSSISRSTVVSSNPPMSYPEEKDRDSIRSTTSSISMSNSSCNNSRQSVTSPISSHIDSTSTSRKSSYDRPSSNKPDIGRHIIDPAELRRLMQERLDSSTSSSSSSHIRNGRRSAGGPGMKKSASMQAALDSYARSPIMKDDLSASTSTSPDSLEYRKYTFGKAHPAQAPSASYSPIKEGSKTILTPHPVHQLPVQSRMPRSESANSVDVQALFAALPPPKRRSAGPVRPSSAGGSMPTLQETASHPMAI